MALQRVGDADTDRLFQIVRSWTDDRAYVQRAAIAAVSEPRLLKHQEAGRAAVDLVDRVTTNLEGMTDRRSDEFRTLRQALAYCWSVVVAGNPSYGRPRMERCLTSTDPDVRWVMRENLRKARLARLDPDWVARLRNELG
jgi:GTP1/Obg family GTP-binding protein